MLQQYTAALVADGSGNATVYVGSVIRGRVHAIKYVPGTIDTNADLTITGETTGVPILTKANAGTSTVWYYPRVIPNKNTDGAAFADVFEQIRVLDERIKIVLAQGGDAGAGSIVIFVDE